MFEYNDGGRLYGEVLDCTVRAYALATNIPYAASHAKFKAHGREDCCIHSTMRFMVDNHPEIEHIRPKCMQVRTFLKQNCYKNIILRVKGHVFCVKNNVILDMQDIYRKCIVLNIWIFDK